MRRSLYAVIFGVLALCAFVFTGCGPPTDIAVEDIAGFAIGPDPTIWMDSPLPPPTDSLDRLVAAYNQADSARGEGDTTPPLFAMMDLADATRITIWFSGEYPENSAVVVVRDPQTGEGTDYRIRSPDLLPAVLELAGDSIDRELLEQQNGAPWLPE